MDTYMKLGPYKGYYGRAFWCDVDNKFKGWIICKERFQFVSNKEDMLNYNFRKAVSSYLNRRGSNV